MLHLLTTIFKRVAPAALLFLAFLGPVGPVHAEAGQTAVIRASLLNVRKAPDKDAPRVGTLKKGARVTVVAHEGEWLKISHEGMTGYVRYRDDYVALDPPPAWQISRLEEQARQIDREIETRTRELAAYGQKEVELVSGLHDIDLSLNQTRTQIQTISGAVDEVSRRIEDNRRAVRALEQRIGQNRQYAARRLTALYKLELMGRLNLPGSAESMFEFLATKRNIERICEYDAAVLKSYLSDKERLATLNRTLDAEKADKKALEVRLQEQHAVLDTERSKRERLLAGIRKEGSLQQAAIASLKQAARELDRTIAALHEDLAKTPTRTDGGFSQRRGLLKMPVEGKIVGKFGKYTNPELNIINFRSGIDIAAGRGEPVRAVHRGQVVYATWFKGYGNMVILDHGDGFYTVYAHLQELLKKKGDAVDTHEVIATVGDTASMTGTALYFEVRHRGTPEDPMKWLRKG
ncbi:MAG: peptidoglycan DD-metalloendopeptidase family protein [Thermodesulfobacteriota bacterium]